MSLTSLVDASNENGTLRSNFSQFEYRLGFDLGIAYTITSPICNH